MRYEWLKKQSDQYVIVIFSGWGFSSEVFNHLLKNDDEHQYDVLFVSGYEQLEMQLPNISHYQERYLLAWSFGVSAFATWLSNMSEVEQKKCREQFDCCIAVNGSMQPIDRYNGIPEVIMQKTIDTLTQESFELFAKRCFGALTMPSDLRIDVAEKKQELQAILTRTPQPVYIWNLVWIAKSDKIFSPKNLGRSWQTYNENCQEATVVQYCDAPHVPFQIWSNWDDVVSRAVCVS